MVYFKMYGWHFLNKDQLLFYNGLIVLISKSSMQACKVLYDMIFTSKRYLLFVVIIE